MFNFLKRKKEKGEEVELQIEGMHCSSCAMNIDLSLEEVAGVIESKTHFAKSVTKVRIEGEVNRDKLVDEIKKLGYKVRT